MKQNNTRFFIIPIGLEIIKNGLIINHANYLLFDTLNNEVERFEPYGSDPPFNIDSNLFDKIIIDKIKYLNFTYISPYDYLPKIGFQKKEIYELDKNYIGDPNGFCALWCVWWCDMRISYPQYTRNKLFKLLTNEINNENYSYKKLIRDYSYFIVNIRDKLLNKINVNINDWLNDNINKQNINKFEKIIGKQIIKSSMI